MKKRSIVLLSSLLALSAAGVATASAFVIKDAANASLNGTVDSALVLEWDSTLMTNVSNLRPDAMAYKQIALKAPIASEGQNAYFHLELTPKTGSVADGLKVEVATVTWTGVTLPSGAQIAGTLGGSTQKITLPVTTAVTYYLRFSIDATEYNNYVAGTKTFGATLTASYDNVAGGAI